MKLKLSSGIRNEWAVRCIGDVIPSLADVDYEQPSIDVDVQTLKEIKADCEWYMDPKAVDATSNERAIYKRMIEKVNQLLESQ